MNLMEQIKFEEEIQFCLNIKVEEDGRLLYDKGLWKKVEPKLRAGWSNANAFDIISKVYFSENGWISSFTLQVDKKKASRLLTINIGDVKVEIAGEEVVAELGGVVNKNLNDVIADIRAGYLPRIMEELENIEKTQLQVDVCYAQLAVKKIKEELVIARYELKEAQEKLDKSTNV